MAQVWTSNTTKCWIDLFPSMSSHSLTTSLCTFLRKKYHLLQKLYIVAAHHQGLVIAWRFCNPPGWRLWPKRGFRALLSPPLMSSRHHISEPYGRWHNIYSDRWLILEICFKNFVNYEVYHSRGTYSLSSKLNSQMKSWNHYTHVN